jgi:Zn finger protein HypA/HybF involved in hydrogenase expression
MEFECDDCSEQFEIITDSLESPKYCPFCGGFISVDSDEEDESLEYDDE